MQHGRRRIVDPKQYDGCRAAHGTRGARPDLIDRRYRVRCRYGDLSKSIRLGTDRLLTRFNVNDHVTVVQSDDSEHRREWFYTRGLSKFGIDEVEVFQPIGLPSPPILEKLSGIAEELIRNGHSPPVGSSVTIQHLALSVRIVRHRTHPSMDMPLILREVSW